MWSNIGKIEENKDNMEFLPSPRGSIDMTGKPVNDAMFIYADCHSSMKGIFFGKYTITRDTIFECYSYHLHKDVCCAKNC